MGKLKKKDLAALNSAYAKGYAKFAYLHNVFDTAPTKDTNQAEHPIEKVGAELRSMMSWLKK